MPRILAISSPRPEFSYPSSSLVQSAVNALDGPQSPAGHLPHAHTLTEGCLIWKGKGAPGMARRGQKHLLLDGTIYNKSALAQEVKNNGDNTAALILHMIEAYGLEKTLLTLNGDFALALFDTSEGSLTLARDRMGLRPLYYAKGPDFFAAASRPGALLALGIAPEINPVFAALFAASHYRVIDNDIHASPYKAIAQLPAGHMLRLTRSEMKAIAWWHPQDQEEWTCSEETLKEQYRELFLDAVALRLPHFQKPFFTLSGGMDSSAILAAARHLTGSKQEAISTVYEDATYDESSAIQHMLEGNVREWHKIQVGNPDVFALTATMIAAHDEPVATATWLPHWLLCKKAAERGADAVTSGLGGDELFGGEYEHFFFHFADLAAAGQQKELEHEVLCWAQLHNHPLYPKDMHVAKATMTRVTASGGLCLPDKERLTRYATALHPDFLDLHSYSPVMDHPFASHLKNRCWQDMIRETSPCCIRAQDRQGGAHGLAVFMPFFDPRLIDFLFRVPGRYKIRHGGNKYLARQAMRGILPEATCDNIVKTGWNAPAHQWFSGAGADALMDMLHSQSFCQRGIYLVPEVRRLAAEHQEIVSKGSLKEHHMMFLWQVVNTELWLQWVDKKGWQHA